MPLRQYLRIWLACLRYSMVRTMMFRFDFFLWSAVELAWMSVNVLLVEVIYRHTDSVAGWGKYEMLLLVGTSMLIQRLLMGFFWSNLFEMGRNVRTGYFDFYLAQPGSPLFMVSTRKLDPDGLANTVVAAGVIIYAAHRLGLHPGVSGVLLYLGLVGCGLVIHYSLFLLTASTTFWIIKTEGIEGSYFTIVDFSRLPREAFRGAANILLVYLLPAVVVSNVPARTLIHGFQIRYGLWLFAVSAAWFALAVFVFRRGLRRYASASS
ncbi:MAG TPA: ABC-2 family transporter protein [Opitutaceae bacterium]|nr:ABC-2 family transporter protein [Opitutaceae bacterium]